MQYEAVIGLEVHSQLKTDTKIFCGCSTQFGALPNSNVCPVCTGMPGVLPVLNKKAVEYAIKAAIALDCKVAPVSVFARKHYFYPDLPKNFQISQYELPLAEHGHIILGSGKKIGITRVHMEEDAGKLLHTIGSRKLDESLVDYNRTGIPLMEIVSEPDLSTPDEAYEYLTELKKVLEYMEVSDCNMEQGSLRCDANVSIKPIGQKEFGTKAEIKNMNSFKGVQKALVYEIKRQTAMLNKGERIVQETRLWDSNKEISISMRSKEEAHDYKYFPEPDLPPLKVSSEWIDSIKKTIPEFAGQRKKRFIEEYKLSEYDSGVLTSSKKLADYFEQALNIEQDKVMDKQEFVKLIVNWITVELLGKLNAENKEIENFPVPASNIAKLVSLISKNIISGKIGKIVFEDMYNTGKDPDSIIKEKNLVQITDESEIINIIKDVLKESPAQVEEFKQGKERVIGFFVGQVMKKSKGKANPQAVNKLLKQELLKL